MDKITDKINELEKRIKLVSTSTSINQTLETEFNELKNNLADVATSGDYGDLSNKPTIPSDIDDLTDNQNMLFSGDYTDLSNKPTLADVATTGNYADLVGTPTVPRNMIDFVLNGGYVTDEQVQEILNGTYEEE